MGDREKESTRETKKEREQENISECVGMLQRE